MSFAPYQDDSPDATRATSPPPKHRLPSSQSATNNYQDDISREQLPLPEDFDNAAVTGGGTPRAGRNGFGNSVGPDERNVNIYGTTLPLRLDFEACLAYLLLPPAGGALLLLLEHRSDYVRYHAWQSSLLFTFLFVVHIILSFSKILSYMLLTADLLLIAWLTLNAYRNANTLDRYELPFFGRMANSFVNGE